MKTLVLTITIMLAFVVGKASAQDSWTHSDNNSVFDGSYSIAKVVGYGEFPYNNPKLCVRVKDGRLSIFVLNVNHGSRYSLADLTIKLKFDGDDRIYNYGVALNKEGDMWAIDEDLDELLEIIGKLKTHNAIGVRLSSNYANDDYIFSLKGSTAAINKLNIKL